MSRRRWLFLVCSTAAVVGASWFVYFASTAPTVSNVVSCVEDASEMQEVRICRNNSRLHASPPRSDDELRNIISENLEDVVWLGDTSSVRDDSTVLSIPAFATLWDHMTSAWPVSVLVLGDADGKVLGYLVK